MIDDGRIGGPAGTDRFRPRAQLRLVMETARDDAFVLDGVVSFAGGDEVGEPVVLFLARPETSWFDAAVGNLLSDWARRSALVKLEVRRGRRGAVAVLEPEGQAAALRLDLLAVS